MPPEPKKKRGRPPGVSKKTPVHKKQKFASSPAATPKHERHHRSPSPFENSSKANAHSKPLSPPQSRLLNDLVIVVGEFVDVFGEFIDQNRNADQGDGLIAPIYDPDFVRRAKQIFHRSGDHGAETSSNSARIPQQTLGEDGESESVNSAKGAASGEVKMST